MKELSKDFMIQKDLRLSKIMRKHNHLINNLYLCQKSHKKNQKLYSQKFQELNKKMFKFCLKITLKKQKIKKIRNKKI